MRAHESKVGRRDVTRAVVLDSKQIADRRLALGDAVEVAHPRRLCSDEGLWQCDPKSCLGFGADASKRHALVRTRICSFVS